MKISTLKLCIIEGILFIALLLNTFVINVIKEYTLIFALALILLLVILLLGYEKANHRFRKDMVLSMIIYTLSFHIVTYVLGIYLGFVKTGYSLIFTNIIKNIVLAVIIIVLSEILRYGINTKGEKNKIVIILSGLFFVMLDISLLIHLYDLETGKSILNLIAVVVLPSISKNTLMTYISLRFGWLPTITYRFIMELPIYFIAIIPNFNAYLQSVVMLVFPMAILYRTHEHFKQPNVDKRKKSLGNRLLTIVIIIVTIIVICLTSSAFKYYMLTIGSGSMSPSIDKGDIVIASKINKQEMSKFKINDVLIYRRDKMIIVHRIVEIKHINDQYYFKTKGDINSDIDSWTINEKSVIGKALFKVPYIGYPIVWLNETLDGGK